MTSVPPHSGADADADADADTDATPPWTGGDVTRSATCVLAPNASPWTLDGTNTWLLRGAVEAIVIDPGPDDPRHLQAIEEAAERHGLRIALVVLTHGHIDHAEGARAFAERHRVPVRAFDPAHRLGDEGLVDGDVLAYEGIHARVITTPGHSSDSVSLVHDDALLTGDTVLGRGTSLVAWPDDRLGDYLMSLDRLRALSEREGITRVLPGHGPMVDDPIAVLTMYLEHRQQRLAQVRDAVAAGDRTAMQVVERVYADVPRAVWPAAEQTVQAQLEYLRELKELDERGERGERD